MRLLGRTTVAVAIATTLVAAVVLPAVAADLKITVVSLTSLVAPFDDATLEIQTAARSECAIRVLYKSGPSRARGLVRREADSAGRVAWAWRVGSNTTPGRWPIEVTCRKDGDVGVLRTSFEVR